jgi:acyl carrier protein
VADADTTERSRVLVYRAVRLISPAPVDQVSSRHRLVGDLGYDSLRMLELACVLDDLFGLKMVSLDDAPTTATVGELFDYVHTRLADGVATCPEPEQAEAVLRDLAPAE